MNFKTGFISGLLILLLFRICSAQDNYDQTLKIFFLGDFDFGESYQSDPKFNSGVNVIEKYGYDYMFENIKSLLSESDFTIANLETPLTDSSTPKISLRKMYTHWSDPVQTIEYLKKYNIRTVSLGNNHAFDCGKVGLDNTINALRNGGIEFFGAGDNLKQASKPLVKFFPSRSDSFTLVVLTGFEYRKNYDDLFHFYAEENSAGVNIISVDKVSLQLKELRNKYKDPYIVFFPHWGKNYSWKTEEQTDVAHKLIDAGVDLIIGQGSHMFGEAEYYNGHWIIYSIGNSIFNAPGRYEFNNVKPYSFIAELTVRNFPGDKERHLRLYPIFTDNLRCNYQPGFLDDNEMGNCYRILRNRSENKKVFNNEFRLKSIGENKFFEIQLK